MFSEDIDLEDLERDRNEYLANAGEKERTEYLDGLKMLKDRYGRFSGGAKELDSATSYNEDADAAKTDNNAIKTNDPKYQDNIIQSYYNLRTGKIMFDNIFEFANKKNIFLENNSRQLNIKPEVEDFQINTQTLPLARNHFNI